MTLNPAGCSLGHRTMQELPELLPEGAVVVLNDSRVRKARLVAESETGATVEFLLIAPRAPDRWTAVVSKAKRQRVDRQYRFPGDLTGSIESEDGSYKVVRFDREVDDRYLDTHGHVPLPPYIKRPDETDDRDRYQTVFAERVGSAAAPTAGLHFTQEILDRIAARGIEIVRVTLHVGIGTFLPIRTEAVEDHTMHAEWYEVPDETAASVNRALDSGREVVAVGTTSVRTLEAAGVDGRLRPGAGSTELFIFPGYRFRVVSWMFTNFHTPGSSLVVMVSAFAGSACIRNAYRAAVDEEYRFFSYGDAMLIGPGG